MRIPLGERALGISVGDGAYTAVRTAIVTAQLAPGRRLSENELAGLIGVSRTPVREALLRLRDERLVEVVPQLGTFVTYIDEDAVADAHFVRESLEVNALRHAPATIDPAALHAIEDNLDAQERAASAGDDDAFARLDDELHHLLCDLSGRAIAWRLSERARGQLDRVRRLSLPDATYRRQMLAEHRTVVAAITAGDADRAERELRHHLHMVLSSLPDIRRAHPEYFQET